MQTTTGTVTEGRNVKHDDRLVDVELNGSTRNIRPGNYTGITLKAALGVPPEHELDEVTKGEFRPIADNEKTHVKGGEKFVSHCGQGQSS
jgi:hypothetical protein